MNMQPLVQVHEIIQGITRVPAQISSKYFYDNKGSTLFEEITRLEEYYPTRVEQKIMRENAQDIARHIGTGSTVIEFGAGNCEKARNLCNMIKPSCFVAIDISEHFLHHSVKEMKTALPSLKIHAVVADITTDIILPPEVPSQQRLVYYPGSSISNFYPHEVQAILTKIRHLLELDGALLIGVDLLKGLTSLENAYNDNWGVTADFNLNILNHINAQIGANFDLTQWVHRAFFNDLDSRIEMHLEAKCKVHVTWPDGERFFEKGERIHTENSYKYQIEDFTKILENANFCNNQVWTDEQQWFAVILARP